MKVQQSFRQTDRQTDRCYGIDLLRILAVFMVLILHIPTMGEFWDAVEPNTIGYFWTWGLEAYAYCAVNIFAIISGYVCTQSKFKLSKILKFWLQVLFFSMAQYLVSCLVLGREIISLRGIIKSALPVVTERYWYFTQYFFLLLIMPFLNKLISKMSKKQFVGMFLISLFSFCCVGLLFDCFLGKSGYSWVWLVSLYFAGAYMKKYGLPQIKKRVLMIVVAVAPLMMWFWLNLMNLLSSGIPFVGKFSKIFYSYLSLTVVAEAIALFILFVQLKLTNKVVQRIIAGLSSLTFGVYLCHMRQHWMYEVCAIFRIGETPWGLYVPCILGTACGMFAISAFIEWVRQAIFKYCGINKLADFCGNKIQCKATGIISRIVSENEY